MRSIFLKVKLKSLAAEARIIRREEQRELKRHRGETELYMQLRAHRRHEVRLEARATHIAYSMIRGRTLERIGEQPDALENATLKQKVDAMCKKYGPKT